MKTESGPHPLQEHGRAQSRSRTAGARRRLPRAERERHIVEQAVTFFAQVGFGGDTRELAKRANVTHALLFRYFPSKEALIERVYQEVYLGRWNPAWELLIQDRSIPLRSRLVRFYRLYAQTILSYEFVRLLMFAGLRGADMTRRWFALVAERLVKPICREIRLAHGLPDFDRVPPTQTEIELVWGVNSRIFYFGVRKYIYGMPVPRDLDRLIEAEVHTFFDGIGKTLKELVAIPAKAAPTRRGARLAASAAKRPVPKGSARGKRAKPARQRS
jgi:AcrR family transcriptional regulator